jgi:hypothetical protein
MIHVVEETYEDYRYTVPEPTLLTKEVKLESLPNSETQITPENSISSKSYSFGTSPGANKRYGSLTNHVRIGFGTHPKVYIKPARKTAECYLNHFPDSLYCQPYKYDVLVKVPTPFLQSNQLTIGLVDGETGEIPNVDKPSIQIEKITENATNDGNTEVLYRLYFTLCSFHYNKKPFNFVVYLGTGENNTGMIYKSKPFSTFARKSKESDVWSKKRKLSELDFDEDKCKSERLDEDALNNLQGLL